MRHHDTLGETGFAALRQRLRTTWRAAVSIARLIVGIPDYDTYLRHIRTFHPDVTPMSYEAFFAERMQARYARGRSRCC